MPGHCNKVCESTTRPLTHTYRYVGSTDIRKLSTQMHTNSHDSEKVVVHFFHSIWFNCICYVKNICKDACIGCTESMCDPQPLGRVHRPGSKHARKHTQTHDVANADAA